VIYVAGWLTKRVSTLYAVQARHFPMFTVKELTQNSVKTDVLNKTAKFSQDQGWKKSRFKKNSKKSDFFKI